MSQSKAEYESRVSRVIEHMKSDPAGDLSLERLAAEAGFSRFHFHRIFKAVTGLTLTEAVTRVRLDRSRQLMAQRPDLSLTDVALRSGFGSSSNFSRTFRKRYGMPPSLFDHASYHEATQQARASWYRDTRPQRVDQPAFDVDLVELPARAVSYLRVSNPYEGHRVADAMAQRSALVAERGLSPSAWLSFTWDHPDFVPAQDCDYNVGIVGALGEAPTKAPFSHVEFPAMTVASIRLEAPSVAELVDDEVRAIDWLYECWLPGSGFEPTNHPTFEVWESDPAGTTSAPRQLADGTEPTHDAAELTLHLPVTRLAAR